MLTAPMEQQWAPEPEPAPEPKDEHQLALEAAALEGIKAARQDPNVSHVEAMAYTYAQAAAVAAEAAERLRPQPEPEPVAQSYTQHHSKERAREEERRHDRHQPRDWEQPDWEHRSAAAAAPHHPRVMAYHEDPASLAMLPEHALSKHQVLLRPSPCPRLLGSVSGWMVDKLAGGEGHAQRSLMHRFSMAADLLAQAEGGEVGARRRW
jgi:hypothetical protein